MTATAIVIALCLLAGLATALLVRHLRGRTMPSLRAKFLALVAGLIGAEVATLPAALVAFFGDTLFGLSGSGLSVWIAIGTYAALLVYVFARLFPWHEVSALALDPDVTVKDVLARIRDGE